MAVESFLKLYPRYKFDLVTYLCFVFFLRFFSSMKDRPSRKNLDSRHKTRVTLFFRWLGMALTPSEPAQSHFGDKVLEI